MASGQERTAERGFWGGSMNKSQEVMWALLCNLSGEQVARLFTEYYGLQLLDDDFFAHLVVEEYMEEQA